MKLKNADGATIIDLKGIIGENMVKELLGTKKATLSQLQHIATMAKSNPGLGCVNHGDAHLGNIFISSEFSTSLIC